MVRSNVAGSSYDHVVGQDHVDVGSQVEDGGPDVENGPEHVEIGPEGEDVGLKLAENEPHIDDNESSDDNGSEHVEVGPKITDIWTDHVDVGARVADVNGNGANHIGVGADHVDVDDNGNGADHVGVGPVSENGSQHVENGPDSDNGLNHLDVGPEVDDVEPELGDDKPELADNEITDDNGAEDGVDGSEEDAFLFNIDIGSDVDEEVEEIREERKGKRHKEKAADREGQPVQPDNVDEGNRSSDKDGKLEGYETDYISSSDPGEYEDNEQSDDDVPRVRQSLLPRYVPNCVIPMWELGLRFDDNEQIKEAVRKYAFAKEGYVAELLKSNPGSTVSIQVHMNDVGQAMLFRIYVCFQALKQGWKDGCRPFIGVDGCWLKTAQKGEWFLKKLFTDLEHPTGEGITLMSDQQKGLVKVLVEDYPDTAYKMCARHLSTYIEEFDDNLQKLEKLGPTSTEDLLQNPVQHWAKAYFSATSTCDVVDNNMAEAFNAWILDVRCKPIISLLEDIRVMVMSRLHVKRTWASKWRTNISPKALEKLEHNMEQSTHCRLVWNGDGGAWELSGIPCCHDICAMYQENKRPGDYVSNWYNKEKYLAAYNHVLQPGTTQNAASTTTKNVASATTGPPGLVHGTTHNIASATTQNVASATTGPPGIVQSTTQNVASTISQGNL
ncbi:hypothetical protein V6N13_143116 [Hibiscus sabdariffa]